MKKLLLLVFVLFSFHAMPQRFVPGKLWIKVDKDQGIPTINNTDYNTAKSMSNHLTIEPDSLYFYDFNPQFFNIINNSNSVDTLLSVNTGINPSNVPPLQIGDMYLMHNGDSTLVVLDTIFGIGHPLPMQFGDTVKVCVSVLKLQKSIDSAYYVEKMQIISSNSTSPDTAYILIDKDAQNWLTTNYLTSNNFNIYPNPTSGKLYFNESPQKIVVFNLLGDEVKRITLNNKHEIEISDLPNGAYLIKAYVKSKIKISKILLNH